jgi:hypothetical protein
MAARLPSACGSSTPRLHWCRLLAAEAGCRLEALLLPPEPAGAAAGGTPPGAVLLARLAEGPDGCTERLVARLLDFDGVSGSEGSSGSSGSSGSARVAPDEPGLAARVLSEQPVPLPSPACVLHAAAWLLPAAGPPRGRASQPPPAGRLRLTFSSLIHPRTRLGLDLATGAAQTSPGGGAHPAYDPGHYQIATLAVPAGGSAPAVPVTLAWHARRRGGGDRGEPGGGSGGPISGGPVLLLAYGSFGRPETEATFDPARAALMQLGFVVAVAHVRGGGWLGRAWAEAGRGAHAKAAVAAADLAAVADALVARGVCARAALALAGTSAGGWLAAAVLAARPGIAAAAVLTVPCLDPLGAFAAHGQGGLEWLEAEDLPGYTPWEEHGGGGGSSGGGGGGGGGGAPSAGEARAAAALAGWSPYQHLAALAAPTDKCAGSGDLPGPPALLLRAALHDRDVGFWDPAKAAARLRLLRVGAGASDGEGGGAATRAAGNGGAHAGAAAAPLLLRTVPGGHAAFASDAREDALAAAFLAEALGGQAARLAALRAAAGAGPAAPNGGAADDWSCVDWA